MALTKIDICNQALLKVGQDAVTSLDTSSATNEEYIHSAKLCNQFYDQALDEVLRMHKWNCCMKRAIPARLSEAPTFGYDYAYQLPNDCVRIINVFDNTNQYDDGMVWVVEGRKIFCDYSQIYLKYIARPQTVAVLDSLCAQAVICNLALKLCVPLQLNDDWSGRLQNELHNVVLPSARSIDTIENKELMLEESNWIISRDYDEPII